MDNGFMCLAIIELVVILVVVGIRLIFNYIEHRKIKYVLDYIAKNSRCRKDTEEDIEGKESTESINSVEKINLVENKKGVM